MLCKMAIPSICIWTWKNTYCKTNEDPYQNTNVTISNVDDTANDKIVSTNIDVDNNSNTISNIDAEDNSNDVEINIDADDNTNTVSQMNIDNNTNIISNIDDDVHV